MSQKYEYFGKYILLEKLATGGMAEVWLARAPGAGGIGKFVAIKKILPQFSDNPEFIQMFKDEAAIAINLSHSNIVSIYEFGFEKNQLFLVMDYVEGRNLRQILNKMKQSSQRFSTDQIIYVIKEIAAGLDHAHRSLNSATGKPLNITHRDMSPQNIMVSFEGEVKIVDFGIAKAESQIEQTRTGTLKGKFGYMSPEQAEGMATDLRTDIFSLGIVLWELLANDRLFLANNEINTLRKIRECQVPSLTKINPNINPELERITMKALTRDRNLRYQTAANMHRDLNRFLNRHYPDFSPHDYSVFIKTLYTDEILDTRRRLVEYAKIPFKTQTSSSQKSEDDATLVTFPQNLQNTRSQAHTLSKTVRNEPNEPTVTETETFSDIDSAPGSDSQPDFGSSATPTPMPKPPEDYSHNDEISLKTAGGDDELFKVSVKTGPVLDQKFLQATMQNPINVNPSAPEPVGDLTGGHDAYNIEQVTQSYNQRRPHRGHGPARKSSNSPLGLMIFVAFTIGTYVVASTYFPKETAKLELIVKKVLRIHKPNVAAKPDIKIPEIPDLPETRNNDFASQRPVGPVEFSNTTPLVVNSNPSGAEIYLNGINTGKITPARIQVPADQKFSITLRLDRYLEYTKNHLSTDITGANFTATLQKAMVAYIDVDVRPPLNTKVYINGNEIREDELPLTKYAVPANTPVMIRAVNIISGKSVEEMVTLREDQRYPVILKMSDGRTPSGR